MMPFCSIIETTHLWYVQALYYNAILFYFFFSTNINRPSEQRTFIVKRLSRRTPLQQKHNGCSGYLSI